MATLAEIIHYESIESCLRFNGMFEPMHIPISVPRHRR